MPETHPEDKEKLFAYLSIHDFFDTYILQDALAFLQSILKSAGTKKIWKKGYPYSVIHFIQQLEKIVNAAFYIQENFAQRDEAIVKKDKRTDNPGVELLQDCLGTKLGDTFWACFPRFLTLPMFYDPYIAIKRFCRYLPQKEWKQAITDIQEYALLESSIVDLYPPYNLLSIQRHLACLLEACHLMEVRTNKKTGKKTRNK